MTKIEDTPPLTDAATLQRQLEDVGEELDAQEKEITRLRHALDKAELELEDRSLTSAEQALRAVKAERERDEAVERVQLLELRLEGKP